MIFASTEEDWIFAKGCGNACVGDHGILVISAVIQEPREVDIRKHEMKRDAQFFGTMYMCK